MPSDFHVKFERGNCGLGWINRDHPMLIEQVKALEDAIPKVMSDYDILNATAFANKSVHIVKS